MPDSELSHADPGPVEGAALPAFDGVIVALGASAGGLDALDRFFTALPPCDEAAFIVIQHLSPDHKTMMDNLLARHTAMSVAVAEHDVPLQGGHVYVIPPGKTKTLQQGRPQLARAAGGRGGDGMSALPGRPKARVLPLGGPARSAVGAA